VCELLAVSSSRPTGIHVSLRELARHGGLSGPHRDGWGVACYEDGEARVFREAEPACGSALLRFLRERRLASDLFVCHIRQATQGRRGLRNTQPYARELGGRLHVFAHNGNLELRDGALRTGRFRPIGETDSERAFCHLLGELDELWLGAEGPPPLAARFEIVSRFAAAVRALGPANFVYCDGQALFAHSDVRRHAAGEEVRAPGLHALWRNFVAESPAPAPFGLEHEPEQRAVLVASVPLGREGWIPLPRGELIVVVGGHLAAATPGVSAKVEAEPVVRPAPVSALPASMKTLTRAESSRGPSTMLGSRVGNPPPISPALDGAGCVGPPRHPSRDRIVGAPCRRRR